MEQEKKIGLEDFLMQDSENILRLPFKYKDWEIKPLTVGQYARINPYLVKISKDDINALQAQLESATIGDFIEFMDKYQEDMKLIVNTIVGKDISEEGTPDDYFMLLVATIYRLGGKSFLKSISLIPKLSLQSPSGIIAAEKRYMTSLNSLS